MRIVTGSLKGRTIPFNGRKQGNIRVTPARLKEAVFSMLGPLQDQSFLDLCTGSGQMALEAYSRGANVIACDDNDKRCRILKDLLETWHVDENLQLINAKAQILIGQQNRQYVGVYIDPPYDATLSGRPLHHSCESARSFRSFPPHCTAALSKDKQSQSACQLRRDQNTSPD